MDKVKKVLSLRVLQIIQCIYYSIQQQQYTNGADSLEWTKMSANALPKSKGANRYSPVEFKLQLPTMKIHDVILQLRESGLPKMELFS